jgi:7-carboxy-7-deazaguanine synthase
MSNISNRIKVSELFFFSIQGEGRYQGVPSIFLRTFGCNFKCPGFGLPKGQKTTEVEPIIKKLDNYQSYNELPLVSTGCDSYAAVYTEFKKLSPLMTTDQIALDIVKLLPHKEWRDEHLVITGGEPLLGWQRSYPDLLDHELMHNLKEITFETNGTQKLSDDFKDYLRSWNQRRYPHGNGGELTFSVSAKLSCSGEPREEAIKPEIVCEYQGYGYTYLKFVVATQEDVTEALEVTEIYRKAGFEGLIYLMPVGGVESVYSLNNRTVAELAMKYGLRYSDRLQVPLFKNQWGT